MSDLSDQLETLELFTASAKDACVEEGEPGSADLLLAAADLVGRARTRLSHETNPDFDEDELARQAVERLAEDEVTT